jgi:hypothetical protein
VPAMKVTLSAAMRARDVSRPRDEQLAEAEAAEAAAGNADALVSPLASVNPERGVSPERGMSPERSGRRSGSRDEAGEDAAGEIAGSRSGSAPTDAREGSDIYGTPEPGRSQKARAGEGCAETRRDEDDRPTD